MLDDDTEETNAAKLKHACYRLARQMFAQECAKKRKTGTYMQGLVKGSAECPSLRSLEQMTWVDRATESVKNNKCQAIKLAETLDERARLAQEL